MSELPENLTPVRAAHVFDEAHLADYMKTNVDGYRGPARLLQFEGGQSNPTFHITDAGGRMYVLRKKPPGKLLPSAHQVDREYRVIKALSDHTDVPVPKPYALCQDDGVIGTAFYIMEFTPGRVLADPRMPGISPADRARIFDSMNDATTGWATPSSIRPSPGSWRCSTGSSRRSAIPWPTSATTA
jgi:aminoglycoside phosphotransferase (APT) family kinase protein